MAATDRAKDQIVRLSYMDGGTVVVTPEDEDRFVLTAQKAVKACQDQHPTGEAIKSFKSRFLLPLVNWCKRHTDRVQACYLPVPVGHLQVFIIGVSRKYDFELGKDIAGLELQLFDAGWRVNVLQIPHGDEEDLQTFFDVEGALQVYAQLEAAQG